MSWTSEVRFQAGAGIFSPLHRVQTDTEIYPASYPVGAGSSFPGDKAAGVVKLTTRLCLLPKVKNAWSYTSIPSFIFMAWYLVKHRNNFTFYLYHNWCLIY
jgi:hypothetical protein